MSHICHLHVFPPLLTFLSFVSLQSILPPSSPPFLHPPFPRVSFLSCISLSLSSHSFTPRYSFTSSFLHIFPSFSLFPSSCLSLFPSFKILPFHVILRSLIPFPFLLPSPLPPSPSSLSLPLCNNVIITGAAPYALGLMNDLSSCVIF